MTEPVPQLDYAQPTMYRPVWAGRAAFALTLAPFVPLLLLHVLYGIEWVNNGEQPIPPHHGPSGPVEEIAYTVTGFALLAYLCGGVPAFAAHIAVIIVAARGWPVTLGLVAPMWLWWVGLAAWPLSFALLVWDPMGAMYFYLD